MENQPNVIVLLASFNGADWIEQQIECIQNQKGVHTSLFVSDDGSDNETVAQLQQFSQKYKYFSLLPKKKSGGAAKNFFRLLRDVNFEDSCDYVAFSDQDDMWDENKLYSAIEVMRKNKVDGYSSNVVAVWPSGKEKLINKAQPLKEYDYMFESAGPGCTFIFTKKLALQLQLFLVVNQEKCNDVALHDWFTYAFARSKGYQWKIDTNSYIRYRQHGVNVMGANVGMDAKKDRWKKLRGGWYRSQVLLLAKLLQYDNDFPIKAFKRFNLFDRLHLIMSVRKFRRSYLDSLALALFFLLPSK